MWTPVGLPPSCGTFIRDSFCFWSLPSEMRGPSSSQERPQSCQSCPATPPPPRHPPCPPGHFPGRILKSVRGTRPAHTAAAAPPPVDQGFAWTGGGTHGPLVVATGYGRGEGRKGSHGACGTAPRAPPGAERPPSAGVVPCTA